MESSMLKTLKSNNQDKEYPSSLGKLWSLEEETQLLHELANNIDKDKIAEIHERTIGGIISRIKFIAIRMYMKNSSIDTIIEKTKMERNEVMEIIKKHNEYNDKEKRGSKPKPEIKSEIKIKVNVEDEILEIKRELMTMNKNMEKIFKVLETLELAE
jgi:hypothetical protein